MNVIWMDWWMDEPDQEWPLRAPPGVVHWHFTLLLSRSLWTWKYISLSFGFRNVTPFLHAIMLKLLSRWWTVCFFPPLVYLTWTSVVFWTCYKSLFLFLLICIYPVNESKDLVQRSSDSNTLLTGLLEITGCGSMQPSANRHLNTTEVHAYVILGI